MIPSLDAKFFSRFTRRAGRAQRRASLYSASVSLALVSYLLLANSPFAVIAQTHLTPLQLKIREQAERLSSPDVEERRDALMRLGGMKQPDASRVAARALADSSAIVRATAAQAILSLPSNEAAALLVPLLRDRDEFVRREAAYALGRNGSAGADVVQILISALETDKKSSVRGAAAVALGQLGASDAAPALAGALARRLPARGFPPRPSRRKVEKDEFVRRSAAIALGLIGAREAALVLADALTDPRSPADLRREAARSLGLVGDPSAAPVLRATLKADDPHLVRIAAEALRLIERAETRD